MSNSLVIGPQIYFCKHPEFKTLSVTTYSDSIQTSCSSALLLLFGQQGWVELQCVKTVCSCLLLDDKAGL